MTIAARVPSRPNASINAGTATGGVQMMARSGACGRSSGRAWQGTPSRVACFGLTA